MNVFVYAFLFSLVLVLPPCLAYITVESILQIIPNDFTEAVKSIISVASALVIAMIWGVVLPKLILVSRMDKDK